MAELTQREPQPQPVSAAIAWPDDTTEHDRLRRAQGCPAGAVLFGAVDGTLWQVARPLAAEVKAHCHDCALCRLDRGRWDETMRGGERLVAIWRRVRLRFRLALAVLLTLLGGSALQVHTANASLNWLRNPANDRYYLPGGVYDNHAEALKFARRQRAYPVAIGSEAEALWLGEHRASGSVTYLLGLREVDLHGNWQWVTGEPLAWTNWADGEPAAPQDERLRVAVLRQGAWYAVAVPEQPGEPFIRHAILERRTNPAGTWEPTRLVGLLWFALALLLAINTILVVIERRVVALRLRVDWQ